MRDRLIELINNLANGEEPIIDGLEDWSDAIADHLLANGVIVPPCKVGDKMYFVCGYNMAEYEIYKIEYDLTFFKLYGENSNYVIEHREFVCFYPNPSRTIFFSKDEAEQTLAKMKGGEE